MEIGGINQKNTADTINNSRTKASDGDFEKRLQEAVQKGDKEELKEVCNQFEGIFLSMMYKQMKATVPQNDYLQNDSATQIYNSMLDDQLCEEASKAGIGLGDVMYKQLSKQYHMTESDKQAFGGSIDEKK